MKIFLAILLIVSFSYISHADIYAVFDKESGECKGVNDIKEDYVPDWAKNYILKIADESYRGKPHYEVKLENGNLRLATQQEIDDYLDSVKPPTEKEKLLTLLEDEDIKTKIKNIKN